MSCSQKKLPKGVTLNETFFKEKTRWQGSTLFFSFLFSLQALAFSKKKEKNHFCRPFISQAFEISDLKKLWISRHRHRRRQCDFKLAPAAEKNSIRLWLGAWGGGGGTRNPAKSKFLFDAHVSPSFAIITLGKNRLLLDRLGTKERWEPELLESSPSLTFLARYWKLGSVLGL